MQWDKKPKQNEGISKTGDCKVSTAAAFAKCANGPPKKYKNYVLHCDCERAYTSIDQKTAVVAATSPACSSFNRKALSKKAAKDAQKTLDDYAVAWFNACGKWLKGGDLAKCKLLMYCLSACILHSVHQSILWYF